MNIMNPLPFFFIIEPVLVISSQGSCSCNQPNTMSIFLMHFLPCERVRITKQSRAGICINGPKVNCWDISWIFVWGCLLFFWMFWHAADLFLVTLGRLQNQRYQQHCAHKLRQPFKWKSMNVLGKRRWETWHTVTPNTPAHTLTHARAHKGKRGGLATLLPHCVKMRMLVKHNAVFFWDTKWTISRPI